MGLLKTKSRTLPSSPIHHHSSSCDFEFTVSLSPPKSTTTTTILRPADELFYKGQLLPLHLSPRNSMVRTLLLTSNTTITARHSSDYHSSFSSQTSDSSRPSSATHDDINLPRKLFDLDSQTQRFISNKEKKALAGKQFSFNGFSSVFRKETKPAAGNTTDTDPNTNGSSVKEKIRKYLKKVKPFYDKLSQKTKDDVLSPSFSGNLRFLRRTSCVSSCPSTMPSSPNHSGVLCRKTSGRSNNSSSTEELHCAIQGAIAHCKNSMTQNSLNRK